MTRARVPLLVLALLAGASPARADPPAPQELKKILVIPGSHLDVGFTAPPSVVTAKRVATLDAAIEAAEKDPAFRWTEECGYVVHAWLGAHAKDATRVARLRALVKAGRIGMGACWVNSHAALFPMSLHVLFAWHDEAEKAFGVRPSVAIVNDVPSVPDALVNAAVDAGVHWFICGPNLAFSPPLPKEITGFRDRETARGSLASFFIDPDSYTAAFTRWGIDPVSARFFAKERYGNLEGKDLTRAAIAAMGNQEGMESFVLVQHAFDNWGVEAAVRLSTFATSWNATEKPKIVLATPEQATGNWSAPEKETSARGEWDGTWEEARAQCPHWTARLRTAAKGLGPKETLERRLALATAMDHTGTLGPCWPGMLTEEETVQHNAEWQAIFKAAIGPTEDRRALTMLSATNEFRIEEATKRPDKMPKGLDAAALDPAVRRGRHGLVGPWFEADSPVARAKTGIEADERSVTLWARLDRGVIPGDDSGIVVAGWDLPLSAALKDVRLAPLGPDGKARGGKRLLGRDPDTWIAPDGVEVRGPDFALTVTSSHAFSWRLVERDGKARLQAMLVRQSRRCEFKGGGGKALAFEELYPGEPRLLDAELVVSVRAP